MAYIQLVSKVSCRLPQKPQPCFQTTKLCHFSGILARIRNVLSVQSSKITTYGCTYKCMCCKGQRKLTRSFNLSCISVNSTPYHPPGQPRAKFQNFAKYRPPRQIFLSNSWLLGFPDTLYVTKFHTLPPLSRSQLLSYPMNIVGRTYIYE